MRVDPTPEGVQAWLRPEGLGPGVGALMSTRAGGCSVAPWGRLNLGTAVGDDPEAVAHNRVVFAAALGAPPVFLRQVHGTRVVHLGLQHADPAAPIEEADACVTVVPGVACTVQVADCLPVLLAAPGGRGVAAAHAGWRGLAAGVLEATLHELCAVAHCTAAEVRAWLGPCIGPQHFEVGSEVREAMLAAVNEASRAGGPDTSRALVGACFAPHPSGSGKWLADLAGLARLRLAAAGVGQVSGGAWCTHSDASRFFSFRRDGVTGRMAAAIWRLE
jgi:polyphenol oxidase